MPCEPETSAAGPARVSEATRLFTRTPCSSNRFVGRNQQRHRIKKEVERSQILKVKLLDRCSGSSMAKKSPTRVSDAASGESSRSLLASLLVQQDVTKNVMSRTDTNDRRARGDQQRKPREQCALSSRLRMAPSTRIKKVGMVRCGTCRS